MSKGTKIIKVSFPYCRVKLNNKTYLIDSIFMRFLLFPSRRALLIFPDLQQRSEEAPRLTPLYTCVEAFKALEEALIWGIRKKYDLSIKTMRKFRFSLLFPMILVKRQENNFSSQGGNEEVEEWELNASTYLLSEILKNTRNVKNVEVNLMSIVYVPLSILGGCKRVEKIKSLSSGKSLIDANYMWLLSNDSVFKKKFDDIVGRFLC